MKTINVFFILLCLYSITAKATPQKIEMIFLSPQSTASLMEIMNKFNKNVHLGLTEKSLTENDLIYRDNCIPMGEGCYHPQYGYLNRKAELSPQANRAKVEDPTLVKTLDTVSPDPEFQLKTFNATETSLINCDKGNYFDIFCGKEKEKKAASEIEIWFDISSSLRAADYNKDPNLCNRRTFLSAVMDGCKNKVSASIYNTTLKDIGELSSACLSYGGNDEAKLLKWIKDSKAKILLIVTDIDEMSKEMRDFLDTNGAKFTGEMKPFTSTDLVNYAKDFVNSCNK